MASTATARVLISIATWLATFAAQTAAVASVPPAQEEKFDSPRLSLSRFTLRDGAGPPVRYVLSRPGHKPPLVLYIQGSGCVPPFIGLGTSDRNSTIMTWTPLAAQQRYAVMEVDKPYQPVELPNGDQPGTANDCPQAFNAWFSYDHWLATLKAALRHALTLPDVDASGVLVVGISEGAAMAAGLAHAVPEVSDVALIGGPPGATRLYDFAARIYTGEGSDKEKLRRLRELDATVDGINADPSSITKFFSGHTYLRWSSFFAQSHREDLARSNARVYMVSGMQDTSVPTMSTEVGYTRLRGLGRDVIFQRIPNAGPSLNTPESTIENVQRQYDEIILCFERR